MIVLSTGLDWANGNDSESSVVDASESEDRFNEETLSSDDVENVDEDREETEEEDDDEHEEIIDEEIFNLGDGCTVIERLNAKKNKQELELDEQKRITCFSLNLNVVGMAMHYEYFLD